MVPVGRLERSDLRVMSRTSYQMLYPRRSGNRYHKGRKTQLPLAPRQLQTQAGDRKLLGRVLPVRAVARLMADDVSLRSSMGLSRIAAPTACLALRLGRRLTLIARPKPLAHPGQTLLNPLGATLMLTNKDRWLARISSGSLLEAAFARPPSSRVAPPAIARLSRSSSGCSEAPQGANSRAIWMASCI